MLAALPVLLTGLLWSLPPTDPIIRTFRRIDREVKAHSRAYETLGQANRRMGHRLTGSDNGRRAEDFAHQLLKSYGLQVRYQPFEAESWSRQSVSLSVAPQKSDNFRDIPVVSLAHSPVSAQLRGELVDVGNGLAADFDSLKSRIAGKVVLCNVGLLDPPANAQNLHRSEKTSLAIQHGAKGIIMVNTVPGNVLLTGTASVTGSLIPIPAVCISLESGQQIREWMGTEPLLALVDMKNKSGLVSSRNIIATLKGRSDEKIVIGGHLDSWDLATGSIDNGLGSFSIMDIARTFHALHLKPYRSIEFVLFMGEEQGLLGSKAYVKQALADGSADKIKYMLNLDMTHNPAGLNTGGRRETEVFWAEIGKKMQSIDTAYHNIVTSRAGLHSDHQPFMLAGIPTAAPISRLPANVGMTYHTNLDTFDKVDKPGMVNTVRFVSMLLYGLADARELPTARQSSEQTRDFLTRQGLREQLMLGNDWPWSR